MVSIKVNYYCLKYVLAASKIEAERKLEKLLGGVSNLESDSEDGSRRTRRKKPTGKGAPVTQVPSPKARSESNALPLLVCAEGSGVEESSSMEVTSIVPDSQAPVEPTFPPAVVQACGSTSNATLAFKKVKVVKPPMKRPAVPDSSGESGEDSDEDKESSKSSESDGAESSTSADDDEAQLRSKPRKRAKKALKGSSNGTQGWCFDRNCIAFLFFSASISNF